MRKRNFVFAAPAVLLTGPAFAALSEAISTELGVVKADVTTLGGLGLLVVIAIVAFKYLKRAV